MNFKNFLNLLLTLIIPLILFLIIKKRRKDLEIRRRLPPGPKTLPIIGNLHLIGGLPHRSLQKLSDSYGGLMWLMLGSTPTLVVSSADKAREIFKFHDLAFSGRPGLYFSKKFTHDFSSIASAPYGDYWREVRKIVVLELMTVKKVKSFSKIRSEEVAVMMDSIADHGASPVDLSALSFSVSNKVVCRVAFDDNADECVSKFQEMLIELQRIGGEFNVADFFPGLAWINTLNGVDSKLDKYFRDIDGFFDKVIENHRVPERRRIDQEDIVDVLLRLQMDPDREMALKDEHIKAILFDIFAAGTDTSAAVVVWAMAELIRNPEVKQKAQQEVREACKEQQKVEENDLHKLTYLKQILKETLRLHAPAPLMVPRETMESCTIDNKYTIPEKTRVIFNAAAIGTDPKYWENPEEFMPQRFSHNDIDFRGQHFELLPFGCGRRGCPGINFSILQVEMTLANLLFLFDWELPPGVLAEDLDMEEAPGITVHKKVPLFLVATSPKVS